MYLIDVELIERFTGQRRITSLEAASGELMPAQAALNRVEANRNKLVARIRTLKAAQSLGKKRLNIASLPERLSVPAFAVGLIFCGSVAFCSGIALSFAHFGLLTVLLGTLSPFLGLTVIPVLFPHQLSKLREAINSRQVQLVAAERDRDITEAMLVQCQGRYRLARQIYDGLARARDYPLSRLLNVNFRGLSGSEFEQFLYEVFSFLGYNVTRTGQSGDQGVDLLVERRGRVIAVQAKCYSSSVSNSAIQQVHTGMSVYARRGVTCHQCVVITASDFTRGAIEAAQAVNCTLIGGNEIPSLIRGRFAL